MILNILLEKLLNIKRINLYNPINCIKFVKNKT